MNTSRKSHRKTRTGCGLCKKRKIKCDEQKPQCNNCIKHSVQCDFLVRQPGQHNSPGNQSSGHHQSPSGALDMSTPPMLNAQPESLNLMDLELLHNFTTSTFSTLSFDPLLRNLWRLNVAQIGFQYGFVMRGILAVSALHLAYYHPAKRDFYLAVGMNQHQTALRVGISMVSNVTQENCSAIYIFSVLTFYFTLASPRKPGNILLMGDSGISDWLYLLRGTVIIVENNSEYLTQGPLGPMFEFGRRRIENREGVPGLNEVQELKQFIRSSSTDPQHLEIYLTSIEELDRSLALLYNGGIQNVETAHIFTWAMRMSEEYLLLLREGAQEALAIFAFSCVLLKYLDCHWWMDGWSTHLISKTYYMLDEEHRLWVRWPVEEIGWIPMQDEISHHNGAQTHPSQIHPALGGTSS